MKTPPSPPKPIAPNDIEPEVHHANYFRVTDGSWPQHTITDLELVLLIQGSFSAQDAQHPKTIMQPGDVLLIRSGFPCDFLRLSEPDEAFISCIHFELMTGKRYILGDYSISPDEPWIIPTRNDWVLAELFRRCAAESAGYGRYREMMLSGIFREIWVHLMRYHEESRTETNFGARMQEMITFIQNTIPNPVDRHLLAQEFHLTPEHVNYLFKKHLGITPTQMIQRERCLLAVKILNQGRKNVAETAAAVGYPDPYHFSRVFSRVMGRPPSAYL